MTLTSLSRPAPEVSVVIPYFEDQNMLDLVLTGLELDQGVGEFEVVIADDGSARPPQPGRRRYSMKTVRHANLGNRTGSARNLGAEASSGDTLVFLDGDTVPAQGFLAALTAACEGRHLTVGRRRHADLSALTPSQLRLWLTGGGPAPPLIDEPGWLADGYASTNALRRADLRSYRYIISAVLACPRDLFERLGGFAEELAGYGGEDWELARRAWLAGADFRYAPDAVAWHDGPDLGGRREDVQRTKNQETLRIAQFITDPALRGRGLIWKYPRVVVRCAPTVPATLAAWIACAEGLLRSGDVAIWTGDGSPWPLADPRIQPNMPSAQTIGRAELVIDLAAPVVIEPATIAGWQGAGPVAGGALLLASSPRDIALGTAVRSVLPPTPLEITNNLEAWFASSQAFT